MSKDWFQDIHEMHKHYGVHEALAKLDEESLRKFLVFRYNFLKEEMKELGEAIEENHDPEEIVDALIDLCVVAIGTLDAYNIDGQKAWDEVLRANMSKRVGVKESRPNPLGLPDLIKPEGWTGPNHEGNHGDLTKLER